jgi:hypothetical protein
MAIPMVALAVMAFVLSMSLSNSQDTEAAGAFPEMHLAVSGGGTVCSGATPNIKCTANSNGTPFTVSVLGARVGTAPAVGGFQTETFLNGLMYTMKSCSAEVTMEPEFLCLGPTVGAGGQVSHGNTTGLIPPLPNWTNNPSLVSMPNIACPGPGTFALQLTVAGMPPASALGSKYKDPTGGDIIPKTALSEGVDFDGPGGNPPVAGVPLADKLVVNCATPPTATPLPPTATPTNTPTATDTPSAPEVQKGPALANLFLTRQGAKIPPASCEGGTDGAVLTQTLTTGVTGNDKHGDPRTLGGFSFAVKYDPSKVCIEIDPAGWALNQGAQCTEIDSQGVAQIVCNDVGKDPSPPADDELDIATITVKPQPDLYSLIKPNNGNGQAIQILNINCKLTDRQGDPILPPPGGVTCTDSDVTIRFLEGDVEPDCAVDGLDTQAIAFRWGASKGHLLFNDRFNLEPSPPAFDNDIDVNDLQFVYGRVGSDCNNQWPLQPPVNPKE